MLAADSAARAADAGRGPRRRERRADPVRHAARLPAATAHVLRALAPPAIYVVGPRRVGSHGARPSSGASAGVRIASPDAKARRSAATAERSQNAIAVARFTDGTFGWGVKEPGHGLVFANASRPLDAPAAALLSATGDYGPLLLLDSAHARCPPPLTAYLSATSSPATRSPQFRPVRGVYNHGWLIGDEQRDLGATQAEIDSCSRSPRAQPQPPKNRPSHRPNNRTRARPTYEPSRGPPPLSRKAEPTR